MSTLSLRLPDSLHEKVRELAAQDDVSINQFIATAVAEKLSAILTREYLETRARRGSRAAFERVLAKVPDAVADPGDEWDDEPASVPPRVTVKPATPAKSRTRSPRR